MNDTRLKLAVFVDFDNIEIGVKTTLGGAFDVGPVLDALKERGEVVSKVAYGDWTRAGDHSRLLTQHAIKLVQRNLTPGGDKNGADINLALDALEMVFTHEHINAFVIVGGDSDFISLVEKLKQYDKMVFVVGGRAFTSVILQRNCHEFVAYENLVGGQARRTAERGRRLGQVPLSQALPLVRRALKVLADREVSPQLGLLKSTLLQLDSTFSERTYGVSSFREFAEKLAEAGYVTLKHAGRNVQLELRDEEDAVMAPVPEVAERRAEPEGARSARGASSAPAVTDPEKLAEGVEKVRQLFQHATAPPRWPMYIRNVKQHLRATDPAFDERRFGVSNIVELLRACQREGLFRLERDRKGVLRVFPAGIRDVRPGVGDVPFEPAEVIEQPAQRESPIEVAVAEPVADVTVEVEPVQPEEPEQIVEASVQEEPATAEGQPKRRRRRPAVPARKKSAARGTKPGRKTARSRSSATTV
ncbi:MAG: NYN domain-containing protein [Acidobacteria bacterium]|nr:NYN domain-containing protein [Acidobacteriota bacterium]